MSYNLLECVDIGKSGYGGVLPNGQVVDRRKHPQAIAMKANSMMGIPKPRRVDPEPEHELIGEIGEFTTGNGDVCQCRVTGVDSMPFESGKLLIIDYVTAIGEKVTAALIHPEKFRKGMRPPDFLTTKEETGH